MSGCKSASEYKGMDKYCGESRHKDASGHNGTSRWNSRSRCKWAQVGASGLKSMSGYTRAQSDIRGQGGIRLAAAARTQVGMRKYKDVPFPFMPAHPFTSASTHYCHSYPLAHLHLLMSLSHQLLNVHFI